VADVVARTAILVALASLIGCTARPFDDPDIAANDAESESEAGDDEAGSGSGITAGTTSEESSGEESSGEESTSEESTSEESTTEGGGAAVCRWDPDCPPGEKCYLLPYYGGLCGECSSEEEMPCPNGGCTPPDYLEGVGSMCNTGEYGDNCWEDETCQPGLKCTTAFIASLFMITTCGACGYGLPCPEGMLCAPTVDLAEFWAVRDCIEPHSLPQDSYCYLPDDGDVCASGICSPVPTPDWEPIGACGECMTDSDCPGGNCVLGQLVFETGTLTGSTCQ
jgi:hypothetical protein